MRLLLSSLALLSAAAFAADVAAPAPTSAPAGAGVYFIEPTDGAIVKQEFTVRFGLHGMGVAQPALRIRTPVTITVE